MIDDARFEALRDRLGELHGRSHALARQIGDVDLNDLRGPADLALIPVLRKSDIAALQRAEPPFGGLAAAPAAMFARLFASAGGIYEPESAGSDPWDPAPRSMTSITRWNRSTSFITHTREVRKASKKPATSRSPTPDAGHCCLTRTPQGCTSARVNVYAEN